MGGKSSPYDICRIHRFEITLLSVDSWPVTEDLIHFLDELWMWLAIYWVYWGMSNILAGNKVKFSPETVCLLYEETNIYVVRK